MRLSIFSGLAGVTALLVPLVVFAQAADPNAPAGAAVGVTAGGTPPPATPPAQAAVAKPWKDAITVEGLVDAYGGVRFGGYATQPANFRVFDGPTDGFVLAYTELAVAMKAEPVGFRFDLGFGQVADLSSSAPGIEVWKHIQQAYVTYALATSKPITIDVGKFVTSAGAEVIEARGNWNYSRSFLFGYAIPFTHTGVRLTVPLTSAVSMQASVVNGWDLVLDNNAGKTFGLSFTFAAPTGTTIILNTYAGTEPVGMATEWRLLGDLIVSHTLGSVSLMLNADLGHQGDANWYGVAGYARMALGSAMNFSARGEFFADPQGFRLNTGVNTKVGEITATLGFPVGANGELRAELRGDFAGDPIFVHGTSADSQQFTATAAALAWF